MSENLTGSPLALEPLSLSQSAIGKRIARTGLEDSISLLEHSSSSPTTHVLWRNTATGENLLWLMDHTTPNGNIPLPFIPDLNWQIGGTGDLNSDGKTDVLWHNQATGENFVWFMEGVTFAGGAFLPTVPDPNWSIQAVGDFTPDATPNVVWRNSATGENLLWVLDGINLVGVISLPNIPDPNWQVQAAGDLNGDGETDLLWRNRIAGENVLWVMNDATVTDVLFLPAIPDPNWQMQGTGDFDGDGQTDIFWRNFSSGENLLWRMNGISIAEFVFLPSVPDPNWQATVPFTINPPLASISGTQWNDLNGNGIQDAGEPGLAGWTIYLDQNQNKQLDSGEQFTTTDTNGNYGFTGLAAGTYTVAQVAQSGWDQIFPGTPATGALTPGNLLISTNKTVSEYTPAGTLVRSSAVPDGASPSSPASEQVRDVIVDRNGDIQAYNGTFDPYLSTYDPNSNIWSHHTFLGWSTVNNISYGGIASYQNFVFVSDMRTFGTTADEARGIVRFDMTDYSAQRFAELGTVNDSNFIDLTIGLDGLLYALEGNGEISVFDPLTLDLLRSLNLTTPNFQDDFRAIAINAAGDIFASNWNGRIYHYSGSGILLEDVDSTKNNLTDIDVSATGQLVVGDRFGNVILTDESLDSVDSFSVGTDTTFVAFTTNPLFTLGNGVHQITLATGQAATGINFGNRQQPGITINDGAIAEGNNGTQTLNFTVTLGAASNQTITVDYATANDTAVAGIDYTTTSGKLTFNPGVITQTISVPILGDTFFENDETFFINLTNSVNSELLDTQAIGTIQNDDVSSPLGTTTRVSVASDGTERNTLPGFPDFSLLPSMSADGRYVTFFAESSNLVANDTNNDYDVFVRDRSTNQTTRVSVASNGTQANNASGSPVISADGRYIAFVSNASNLVPNDTNGTIADIFVHDRVTGETTLASIASDGTPANEFSLTPAISGDGRYVAFRSSATNLDGSGLGGIFVRDRTTGETTRVSFAADGTPASAFLVNSLSISLDGRYVAFDSSASNLVPGDTDFNNDVFVYDRITGQTSRVSVASDGTAGNASSFSSASQVILSADGRYVVFSSEASNLVPGDTNGVEDVFIHDRVTGQTSLISAASDGTPATGGRSGAPSISADGRYVAFTSEASNLVPGDTNNTRDVFIRDRTTGETTRISTASDGTQGNNGSLLASLSANGRYVAFTSEASNLVPGDTNELSDVFVHDRGTTTPPLSSLNITLTPQFSGFTRPVHIANADDGSNRLFVVEQSGQIRIVQNGVVLPTPFLSIGDRVIDGGGEQGLLSVAFSPNYATNGQFYVYYTNNSGNNVVARYQVSANPNVATPASEQIILTIPHPGFSNHNGGQIAFGPDGYLYIGPGDGGGGGDPNENAQNPNSLLGKILRIDVEAGGTTPYAIPASNPFSDPTDGVRDEIWALGLRNPWRFSFDRQTGDLYIADVGQGAREEVNFQPAISTGGENYGWDILEGTLPFEGGNTAGLVAPVAEYSHSLGISITGGFVYRGTAKPEFQGIYFYGDFGSGRIWGLRRDGLGWENALLLDSPQNISTFGEDEQGNLYLADLFNGTIYRVDSLPL